MSQPSVNLEQLVDALKRKGIPLPFEMGTFVALEACERVVNAPVSLHAREVFLNQEGEVAVAAAQRAPSEEAACRSLLALLGQLLVQSAPGVPTSLLQLIERGPSAGDWTLRSLRDDLEAALVPLNRAATRRVLSRLLREMRREGAGLRGSNQLDEGLLQDELDALLGVDKDDPGLSQVVVAESEPPASERPSPPMRDWDGDSDAEPRAARGPRKSRAETERIRPPEPEREQAPAPDLEASARRPEQRVAPNSTLKLESRSARPTLDPTDDLEERAAGGRAGMRVGLGLGAAALLLVVTFLVLGRDGLRATLGLSDPPVEPKPAAAPPKPAVEYGALRVNSDPARAQVLLYVGEGPVTVPDLPVGVAHEFIALGQGLAPARGVVPSDAAWQDEGGLLRYELALQTSPATKQRGEAELGATGLPQDPGSPRGSLGHVRVITSPPGAKVYLLVGFTPDARVENLKLDEPTELLLYLQGHALERVQLTRDAYSDKDGALVAELDVALRRP